MEVKFFCLECNGVIDGTADVNGYGDIEMTVELCDTCIVKAHDEGLEEGRREQD